MYFMKKEANTLCLLLFTHFLFFLPFTFRLFFLPCWVFSCPLRPPFSLPVAPWPFSWVPRAPLSRPECCYYCNKTALFVGSPGGPKGSPNGSLGGPWALCGGSLVPTGPPKGAPREHFGTQKCDPHWQKDTFGPPTPTQTPHHPH